MVSRVIPSMTRSLTSQIVEVSGNDPFLPVPEATEAPGSPVKLILAMVHALRLILGHSNFIN